MKSEKKKSGCFLPCVFVILLLLIVLTFGGFLGYNWYTDATTKPANDSTEEVNFTVNEGDTLLTVANDLESKGLIKSKLALQIYLKVENLSPDIKQGEYVLVKNLTLDELIKILEEGQLKPSIWVTIPEGKRYEQVADILQEEFSGQQNYGFNKQEFLNIAANPGGYTFSQEVNAFLNAYKPQDKPLRGFLYPDTYNFDVDMSALQITEVMILNLRDKLSEKNITPSNILESQSNLTSFYEVLTLASIIEKEASASDDRSLIAGVFHNRLSENYMLESDATVNFFTGKNDPGVSFEDRDTPNPYNTYLNIGLPPTPICNPRIESIIGALKPQSTNYFFFRHDENGNTFYAETLEEHINNQ